MATMTVVYATTLVHIFLVPVQAKWEAQVARREAVKEAFIRNYAAYERHAFGYDLLRPRHRRGMDEPSTAGFGGTIVDAMTTMHVMGMGSSDGKVMKHVSQPSSPYERALEYVRQIDFSLTHTNYEYRPIGTVSPFELTIRYVGSMLSSYELAGARSKDRFLVDQAARLANLLTKAWPDGGRMPTRKFNLNYGTPDFNGSTTLADAGSLTLEWHALSAMTGNKTYDELATGAVQAILDTKPIFPGLYAQAIYAHSGRPLRDYVTWGGGSDSFLEYLIKYPLMTGDRQHSFLDVYASAMQSSIDHLLHKTGAGNLTFLGDWSEYHAHGPIYVHSHLACFAGGNIAMAGRAMGNANWTRIGLEIAESCALTYARTATGLGPVSWGWFDARGETHGWPDGVNAARRAFYTAHGFFIDYASWFQQPEVLESVFYAWRITRQEFWRELAWRAFESMRRQFDEPDVVWTCLDNVNDASTGTQDIQESFLYAETFKYLYLIFDDPQHYSLDEYVFTTEAHIFKRRPNSAFGRIQAEPFPYDRLAQDHVRPFNGDIPPALHTSHHGKGWQQDAAVEVAATPSSLLVMASAIPSRSGRWYTCEGKETNGLLLSTFCTLPASALLIAPVLMLITYRLCIWLGRMMAGFERTLYRHRWS